MRAGRPTLHNWCVTVTHRGAAAGAGTNHTTGGSGTSFRPSLASPSSDSRPGTLSTLSVLLHHLGPQTKTLGSEQMPPSPSLLASFTHQPLRIPPPPRPRPAPSLIHPHSKCSSPSIISHLIYCNELLTVHPTLGESFLKHKQDILFSIKSFTASPLST